MDATAPPPCKNHQSLSRAMNPNSRKSEMSNPMRRSFSGSPFLKPSIISSKKTGFNPCTPANSPSSDCPRMHSFSRENMVVSLREPQEDKENGEDLNWKQDNVRSPSSSKGVKNFMSPTVSAASKINASPRKKILVERNEPIRASGLFSNGKSPLMEDLDSKSRKGLKQRKEVSFESKVTYLGDDGGHEDLNLDVLSSADGDFDWKANDEDSVNLDPSFKISPRDPSSWTSPALDPLDGDPSLPPYDPKTNYLSPRPQFLHYRPNSRIELYLNKETDGQKLEECFASEMLTDSEFTQEETWSEDTSSIDMQKDEEKERVEVEGDEEQELLVSEPEEDPISDSEVDVAEDRRVSRPRFFTRKKVNALFFILAAACFWHLVTNSPVMEPSVVNNLSFSELYLPPEISEFSRHHFEVASQKIQMWLHRYFSYTWNLMISFSEQHKLGPLQYANLSLLENSLVDDYTVVFDHSFQKAEPEYEKNVLGEDNNLLVEEGEPIEADESGGDVLGDIIDQGSGEQENTDARDENFEYLEEQGVSESEVMNPTAEIREPGSLGAEVMQETSPVWIVQLQSNVEEGEEQRVETAPAAEIQSEVFDSKELEGTSSDMRCSMAAESVLEQTNLSSILPAVPAVKGPQSSVSMGTTFDESKDTFSAQKILGISLFVLCVLATLALTHMKNKKPTALNAVSTKKMHTAPERRLSRNCQTETEMVEGSCCPSETSSFQNHLSSKRTISSQRPTEERKSRKSYRRESLASSDSSSYGSFTTYEKITGKHGNGEEEVITPVRRSSRIRNQVTSP